MQTSPAVEQNKNIKWSESPWNQSIALSVTLYFVYGMNFLKNLAKVLIISPSYTLISSHSHQFILSFITTLTVHQPKLHSHFISLTPVHSLLHHHCHHPSAQVTLSFHLTHTSSSSPSSPLSPSISQSYTLISSHSHQFILSFITTVTVHQPKLHSHFISLTPVHPLLHHHCHRPSAQVTLSFHHHCHHPSAKVTLSFHHHCHHPSAQVTLSFHLTHTSSFSPSSPLSSSIALSPFHSCRLNIYFFHKSFSSQSPSPFLTDFADLMNIFGLN